ncbi:hypothetical protein BDV59DRAFT_202516 [Aspergillus ambiguus]|uniref:putative APSES transcription factor Xbp1 n=1 Tax=Aspergillus ambiguus TaxID=176160 RepID=UPI003CCCCEAF
MASIESLLNPVPNQAQYSPPSPLLTTLSNTVVTSRSPRQKRQKVPKDAAVFAKGTPRGQVRYPPCEERDDELAKRHREFQIYPMGNIAEYPRHIPYNSDKKTFQEKTVFQYTFKIPGNEKEWLIMWDYNIGLVRTTPLFRSQNYSKTTPAKVLDANPGLREVSHSITGGAIVAQGYWLPFEAARAVAATFCWRIRHALTPIFGLDFPSQCIHPQDRTRRFGQMLIDPAIVQKVTETSIFYRGLEQQTMTVLHTGQLPALPGAYRSAEDVDDRHHRQRRRPALIPRGYYHPRPHHRHHASYPDSLGDYGSSSEFSAAESYCVSPSSPFRNAFTPVNTPRSSEAVCSRVSSPQHMTLPAGSRSVPRTGPSDEDSESGSSALYSESSSLATDCLSELDDDDDEHQDSDGDVGGRQTSPSQVNPAVSKRKCTAETRSRQKPSSAALFAREVKAAHALLSLHMQDATASDDETLDMVRNRRKRRRASA